MGTRVSQRKKLTMGNHPKIIQFDNKLMETGIQVQKAGIFQSAN